MWSLISHSQTVGATDFLIQVSLVRDTFLFFFFFYCDCNAWILQNTSCAISSKFIWYEAAEKQRYAKKMQGEKNSQVIYCAATLLKGYLCVLVEHQACSCLLWQNKAFSSPWYNNSDCWQPPASFHFFEYKIQGVETFYFLGNSSENGFSLNSASKCLRGDWNSESGRAVLVPLATSGSFSLCEGKGGEKSGGEICVIKNLTQDFQRAPSLPPLLSLWKAGGENSRILFTSMYYSPSASKFLPLHLQLRFLLLLRAADSVRLAQTLI